MMRENSREDTHETHKLVQSTNKKKTLKASRIVCYSVFVIVTICDTMQDRYINKTNEKVYAFFSFRSWWCILRECILCKNKIVAQIRLQLARIIIRNNDDERDYRRTINWYVIVSSFLSESLSSQ